MTNKDTTKIVRQRINPSIFDFCFLTTRSHLKAFLRFKQLLKETNAPRKFLDLGCGYKPFQQLLGGVNIEKYIGVDFDRNRSAADVEASIDQLPFEDNSFEAIIASEVLEHAPQLEKAVSELRRVAKNGALVYISTPFILGEHGVPYDFQRITRYKYFDLFKKDEIVLLQETNRSLATPFFIWNVVLENIAIFKMIPIVPHLSYCVNNIFALIGEVLVDIAEWVGRRVFSKRQTWFESLWKSYFYTMPGGYDVIVRIKKYDQGVFGVSLRV